MMKEGNKNRKKERIFFHVFLLLSLFSIWMAELTELEMLVFIPFLYLMFTVFSWTSINAAYRKIQIINYILLLVISFIICFFQNWCTYYWQGKTTLTALLLLEFFIHRLSEKYRKKNNELSNEFFKQMEIRLKARLIYGEKVIDNIDRLFFWHAVSFVTYLIPIPLKLLLNVYNGGRIEYIFPQWSIVLFLALMAISVWGQVRISMLEKPFKIDAILSIIWAWIGFAFLYFYTDGGLYFDFLLIWTCSMAPYFVSLYNFIVKKCNKE